MYKEPNAVCQLVIPPALVDRYYLQIQPQQQLNNTPSYCEDNNVNGNEHVFVAASRHVLQTIIAKRFHESYLRYNYHQ